jgi:hypothetical protein
LSFVLQENSHNLLILLVAPAPATAPAPVPAPAPAESEPSENPHLAIPEKKEQGFKKPAWTNRDKDVAKSSAAPASGPKSTGAVKMVVGQGVASKVAGLKSGGINPNIQKGRKMKTPKIVTDTKETTDGAGNITREITRYITEPDGTKRTEKEVVEIPAK